MKKADSSADLFLVVCLLLTSQNPHFQKFVSHVSECFNYSIPVSRTFTRYKHWFQYPNTTKYPHDTLVLAQFRNPYDWLLAMQHVPHHSPAHLRTNGATTDSRSAENDWNIFLSKAWTTNRTGEDLKIVDKDNTICQEDFKYRDIVSCVLEPLPHTAYNYTLRYSEHQPFYEMRNDGSGRPYDNIMEMRTDKIRNFLSVANYKGVADLWVLQYEYLVLKGTQHLIDRIEEWTGIPPRCQAKPPQLRKPKASRVLLPEMARYIRKHLNWTVEGWVGYEPEPKRENAAAEWRS